MTVEPRIERLQKMLEPLNLEGFFVDSPVDLLYLTGMEVSAGVCLVTLSAAHLFVDGRYLEVCRAKAPLPVSPLSDDSLRQAMRAVGSIGFDSTVLSYAQARKLQNLTPDPLPVERFLQQLRAVKDADELSALREAALLACEGLDFVTGALRPGVSEGELARELEIFWLQSGGERLSFDPIIAFGPHSALPHHRSGAARLTPDTAVLVDLGVQVRCYQSDMTRVSFFGEVEPRMQRIYEVVREALEAAVEACRPGITAGDLDRSARSIIDRAGYGEYFPHSLGHGVGLEVHEWPVLRQAQPFGAVPIEPGMVLTIEPGVYVPGVGGVRLEETVLVTDSGSEILTPRSLDP